MLLFLETIKFKDGKFSNLQLHQDRFNRTRSCFFPQAPAIDLSVALKVCTNVAAGVFRCRVIYGEKIEKIEFLDLSKREFNSLQVVHSTIDYAHKFAQRNELHSLFSQRCDADEIMIVKNGLITDCSIGNFIFKKEQQYVTPRLPILNGTKRQFLINQGLLHEENISLQDLKNYDAVAIINALIDFDEVTWIPVSHIRN